MSVHLRNFCLLFRSMIHIIHLYFCFRHFQSIFVQNIVKQTTSFVRIKLKLRSKIVGGFTHILFFFVRLLGCSYSLDNDENVVCVRNNDDDFFVGSLIVVTVNVSGVMTRLQCDESEQKSQSVDYGGLTRQRNIDERIQSQIKWFTG